MPRMLRTKSSTKIYHIILRGINKQELFYDDIDRSKFLNELKRTKEKFNYKLYGYCLMPNHVHLIIRDINNNLSKVMQSLSVSYANYFNKKYERIGHLFQNRYISKNIETPEYLLEAQRYVHQNPAKAFICKTEDYRWSSYKSYVCGSNIIDTTLILSLFSDNKITQHEKFIDFMRQKENELDDKDILEHEIRTSLTDEELIFIIKEKFNINNLMEIQKYNNIERTKIIKRIKQINGVGNNQISRLTGINKRLIERVKKD